MVKRTESKSSVVDETLTSCGWGSFQPKLLQKFNNPSWLVAGLTYLMAIQGFAVNGIVKTNISTLERRFDLPSVLAGFIPTGYDIAAGILGIPISFIGMTGHRPRILAVSAFIMCMGSFVSVLPHFTTGLYSGKKSSASELCQGNGTECLQESGLSNYVFLFFAGNFLHGVGGAALFTLSAPLLDDNVSVKNSPIYLGVMYAGAGLGPALGYIIGGLFLNIYVDADKVNPKHITVTPSDPRWVGAWWIGYMVSGTLFLSCFFYFSFYGKETPMAAEVRKTRVSEVYGKDKNEASARSDFGTSVKDFLPALKTIITNPVFLLVSLSAVLETLAVSSLSVFIPKFMQNQFGLTASSGAILAGIVVVPGAAGGHILSGFLVRYLKLKVGGILRFCSILAISGSVLGLSFLAKCNPPNIAGVSTNYVNSSFTNDKVNLVAPCNELCNCTTGYYEPVCGLDDKQYFSACHAGCFTSKTVNKKLVYSDCACVDIPDGLNLTYEVRDGSCHVTCHMIAVFMPFFFFLILVTFMCQNAGLYATMRFIPEKQRPLSLGVQWVFVRFLGTVPGPLIMGKIFDLSCLVWQERCNRQGSCWIFDSVSLSGIICIICVVMKFLSSMCFLAAGRVYEPPRDLALISARVVELENKVTTKSDVSTQTQENGYSTTQL